MGFFIKKFVHSYDRVFIEYVRVLKCNNDSSMIQSKKCELLAAIYKAKYSSISDIFVSFGFEWLFFFIIYQMKYAIK